MSKPNLISIPWEDILFKKLLPLINLKDLLNLRSASISYQELVDSYLHTVRKLNLTIQINFSKNEFEVLVKNCRNIRQLNVSKCNWLDDDIFSKFLENNHFITEIDLSNCLSIGQKSMQALILNCSNLKTLRMASCCWLTNGAVESLIQHQSQLKVVDFTKCYNLSELCIIKLVVKFIQLEYLSLAHIKSVTNKTLWFIQLHLHRLKHLNVNSCTTSLKDNQNSYELLKALFLENKLETLRIGGKLYTLQDIEFLKYY